MGLLKAFLRLLLRLIYRVEIRGEEHLAQLGERALVVANHTSFLDAVLLAVFLPGEITFAVNTQVARNPIFRPFLALTRIFPMDPTNPLAMKSLIRHLSEGRRVAIFPEGRITVTGALMKIYDGPGLVADKAAAPVVPIRIEGAQYTPFSRLRGRVRLRWFPPITLTILPPRTISPPAEVRGRARRKAAGRALSDLMTEMMFATTDYRQTLFGAVLDARRIHGGKRLVAEDINRRPASYHRLIAGSFVLGRRLTADTRPEERIGLLLPNSVATLTSLLGLHAYGRVPAMLNYTLGAHGVLSACTTARIRRVITSRRFIEQARLGELASALASRVELIWLEDLAATIGLPERLIGLLKGRLAPLFYPRRLAQRPDAPAVVLFTSGSEGSPKGVVLSHTNLLANRAQIAARVDFSAQDVVLNALPLFHSFGLTAGTLLPITSGMRCFLYPSPLHYRIVPEMAYDLNATILFGTNTFLAGYAKHAHPYDFYSVRYVFAGAEKLKEETRRVWAEKFGVRIFEGYGATETAPVLAVNTPMDNRPGSVGRLLPAIDHRLLPVPGIERGGRLHVHGPNVMLGYLLADHPGLLVPPDSSVGAGWYDTGDIVTLDEQGYLHIEGRAKRFAKVGGEMVSLTVAEELAATTWPEAQHAVVTLPDPQKGEQLVLVTDRPEVERSALLATARARAVGEIHVPKRLLSVSRIPLLGSGKIDYPATQALVQGQLGSQEETTP